MMRFPQRRGQISCAHSLAMTDLLEAHGIAAIKRDELRGKAFSNPELLAEYEDLCQRLEDDVLAMLSNVSPRTIR